MITDCGHSFHCTCCFSWTFRGNFNCPYCIQPLVDKKLANQYKALNNQTYEHTITNSRNEQMSIILYKMKINNLTYFLSNDNDSKVFFSIFNNEEIDFLDEIGYYDFNLEKIIYKYDVTRHVVTPNL
jgi:hypothetical protein